MKIELFNNGYVTDEVSSVDSSEANINLENRIKFVTDIAAISRGKEKSNNPESRYKHLQKEAAINIGIRDLNELDRDVNVSNEKDVQDNINTVGRPFEFIPVVVKVLIDNNSGVITDENDNELHKVNDITDVIDIVTDLSRYGYNVKNTITDNLFKRGCIEYTIYTNGRNYIYVANKYNFTNKEIPFCVSIGFKVLRVCAPMYSWGQIMTHTQLSKISQSDRVSESDDYWLPDDIVEKLLSIDTNELKDEYVTDFLYYFKKVVNTNSDVDNIRKYIIYNFLNVLPQNSVQKLLKLGGYKREIYSRAPYYFKYKEFIIGGWLNDPKGYGHMLLERDAYENIRTSWTQDETKAYAKAIKNVLNKVY